MVTHEQEIADNANRIIVFKDGEIISDKRNKSIKKSNDSPSDKNFFHSKTLFNSIKDNLSQSFKSILANKTRTALSILGIFIGVASVVAMLALGQGAQSSMSAQMERLGTNMIHVRPGRVMRGGVSKSATIKLSFKDVDALQKISNVSAVSPIVSGSAQVVYKNENANVSISGVSSQYDTISDYEPTLGRFFTQKENDAREKVALLGVTVVEDLFKNENPIGKTIKINKIRFKVLGILPEKGSSMRGDSDNLILMPIKTAMYRVMGKRYLDYIEIQVADMSLMDQAEEDIKNVLYKRHKIKSDEEDALRIMNLASMKEAFESMTKTLTIFLSCVAAISLLVGGIGIMNIMLVSVTERTREIGLRKAIGARRKDILFQFLVESIVMTMMGGLLGILFGWLVSFLASAIAGWATEVSAFSIILATSFSIIIGLIFGVWPAKKASELDAIDALRYE